MQKTEEWSLGKPFLQGRSVLGSCHNELMFLVLHIKYFAQLGHRVILNISYFSLYGLKNKDSDLQAWHVTCGCSPAPKENQKKCERSFHKAAIKGDDQPSSPSQ